MTDDHITTTIATYNAISDHYAASMDAFVPDADRNVFLSYLQPRSRVLDVGCAAGRDTYFFAKNGHFPTGVDLSENLLSIARKKAPTAHFILGDIRRTIFLRDSFDAIWACAVLLHLKRDEVSGVLHNFSLLLRTKGLLYIRVKEGLGEGDVAESLSENKYRHFTYFSLDEMQQMVNKAGFSIVKAFRSNERDMDKSLRDLWWISIIARKV